MRTNSSRSSKLSSSVRRKMAACKEVEEGDLGVEMVSSRVGMGRVVRWHRMKGQ
jgi:hypothetical protein